MAVTCKTGDRLERIASELEWLQQRLSAEGFAFAADSLERAKSAADAAGQSVKREIGRRNRKSELEAREKSN